MSTRRNVGREVWALSVATFINRATGFLGLFAAIFFTQTGMSARTVVGALLIVGVTGVLGSLLGGHLADRIGKTAVLIGSSGINVVFFGVLAVLDYSLTGWIVGISAVSVFASQAFVGPASALIAASADGSDRVTRFAFYRIFINVGSIVAPALVGLIGRDHFDILFWLSAAGSVIVPIIMLVGFRGPAKDAGGEVSAESAAGVTNPADAAHASSASVPAVPRPELALLFVYAAMALAMMIYAQHQSAIPLRLDTEPNGVQLYSALLIINPIIVIAVEYPLSHATKKLPAHLALALGVVIMGAGVAITGSFAHVAAVAIAGWVVFSIGECIFAPMSNSYVADLATSATQSRSQGRLAAFQSVGAAVGPGFGSWLLLVFAGGTWAIFMAVTLISAVLVSVSRVVYSRAHRPDREQADGAESDCPDPETLPHEPSPHEPSPHEPLRRNHACDCD